MPFEFDAKWKSMGLTLPQSIVLLLQSSGGLGLGWEEGKFAGHLLKVRLGEADLTRGEIEISPLPRGTPAGEIDSVAAVRGTNLPFFVGLLRGSAGKYRATSCDRWFAAHC